MDFTKNDLKVFDDELSKRCSDKDYAHCIAINRLLVALRYYQTVNASANFTAFMMEKYKQRVFDDFIHLSREHQHQIEDIHQYFIQQKGGKECQVKSCDFASRHHRVDKNDAINQTESESETTMLYQEIMDSLHVYIYHLHQYGLRTVEKEKNNEQKEEKQNVASEYQCYDREFFY